MRVMAWNIQGALPPGSEERIQDQVEYIEDQDCPDILMLNEVNVNRGDLLREQLREYLGYSEIVDTLDWAAELRESEVPPHQDIGHSNGNLTAIHEDSDLSGLTRHAPSIREGRYEDADHTDWSNNFPEKILHSTVSMKDSAFGLWNVRTVPGGKYGEEKIKILEDVYSRLRKTREQFRILAGDLNAPKAELDDGSVIPWGVDKEASIKRRWIQAELDILNGLGELGMLDVFRAMNGYGEMDQTDVSWKSLRYDHCFASESLNPNQSFYDTDGLECSDHAPITAEFHP